VEIGEEGEDAEGADFARGLVDAEVGGGAGVAAGPCTPPQRQSVRKKQTPSAPAPAPKNERERIRTTITE
jgi:hypothetical protein